MEVYDTLVSAVSAQTPADKRRIYRVQPIAKVKSCFVIAASPGQAALAAIDEASIELVTQRERYDATREALHEPIARHNEKLESDEK